MRTRIMIAVFKPIPSMLAIRPSRWARSWCWRIAAANRLILAPLHRLKAGRFLFPHLPNMRIATGLAAGLEAGNILADLIDHRQMPGKWCQPRIRRSMDLLGRGRAGSDQGRVDLVVLRPLQMKLGVGPYLRGLEHDDHEAIAAQPDNDLLLVAAARLDADPLDSALPQPSR